MHTPLCGHASGDPLSYVDTAARNGVSLITFTCHIPMTGEGFAQTGIRMRREDIPAYRKLVEEAREYGEARGVEVLYGIEAEIHPNEVAMREMDRLLAEEPFDYVLGSLHHMLPAFRQWLQETDCRSDAEKIRAYFQCLAAGARSGRYHSLSHPDVIRIYSTLAGSFDPTEHEDAICAFLDAVKESGTCLEINTSGLIKGDFVIHPDPLIIEWALKRGIPFTFGSDSHSPDRVGHYFDEAVSRFRPMGLRQLHFFRGGERHAVAL